MSIRRALPSFAALLFASVAVPVLADDGGPPFLKEIAGGQTLPQPWGLAVVYSGGKQDLKLDDFELSDPSGQRQSVDFVGLNNSKLKSNTVLLKGDLWLFPFLNVFGFAGQAKNKLDADVTVPVQQAVDYVGSNACANDGSRPAICDQTLTQHISRDSDALNYGGGATFAIAKDNVFGLVSLIYATSNASGNDTKLHSFNASPRVGYRFPLDKGSDVAVYAGATFQNAKVDVSGTATIPVGNQDVTVDYKVSQKNDHNWSYLGGANWDITRDWSVLAEYSVGARDGLTASVAWRFGG